MKFVITKEMADAFRLADGTLPANVEVWDGYTRASDGKERTWLRDSVLLCPDKLPTRTIRAPASLPATPSVTFKGKPVAQWKRERKPFR